MTEVLKSMGWASAHPMMILDATRTRPEVLGNDRGDIVESELNQFQPSIVIFPEVALEAGIKERDPVDSPVAIDIGIDVEQLLADVRKGTLSLAADKERGVCRAELGAQGIRPACYQERFAPRFPTSSGVDRVPRRARIRRIRIRQLDRGRSVGTVRIQHLEIALAQHYFSSPV